MTLTEGNVIDHGVIKDDLRDDCRLFDVAEVPFDPWQLTQMSVELFSERIPMVEVAQTTKNFSEPMKELVALVISGRFHHNGCPVLAWMASNTVCRTDNKDNIYPLKERPENKIDGIVALIMALNRAMLVKDDINYDWETRKVIAL